MSPKCLIRDATPPGTALLCWGKAALSSAVALESRSRGGPVKIPALIICPQGEAHARSAVLSAQSRLKSCWAWQFVQGEHPLPGVGSLRAGELLLDFFDSLRRMGVRRLDVHLSGGASSLAWLPRGGRPIAEIYERLKILYTLPLSISELNAERSHLCAFKAGGAVRLLKNLAGDVQVRVFVISDVFPYGPEVVGSGPFWDGVVPHQVLASNSTFVDAVLRRAEQRGWSSLEARSGCLGSWSEWVEEISSSAKRVLLTQTRSRRPSALCSARLIVQGGESHVDLRRQKRGRGGRQTQIAAGLAARLAPELAARKLEILCISSDGLDGASGAAGAWLNSEVGHRAMTPKSKKSLLRAIACFDSASWLDAAGALIPASSTGTNVQDVVIVKFN